MKPAPLRFAGGVGMTQLITGGGRLIGWSFLEGTGVAPAACNLWDSSTTDQNLLLPVTLNANESDREWQPIHPMPYEEGLLLDVTVGSIAAVLWVHPSDPSADWVIPVLVIGE